MLDVGSDVVQDHEERGVDGVKLALAGNHELVDGHDEVVGVGASELEQSNRLWQGFLRLKAHVEALTECRLRTHRLKNEYTHPYHALLGGIHSVLHGIEDTENQEIVRAVGIDNEGSETLVALQGLPEKDQNLRCPLDRSLTPRKIGTCGLHLFRVIRSGNIFPHEVTYRLVQNPCHAVDKELKVLGPVQPSKVMAVVVLWRGPATVFWNGIQQKNKEELQAVDNQDLFGIFPNDVVVGDPPRCWVILHRLFTMSFHRHGRDQGKHTVLSSEQRSVKTACLSWQVVI